MKSQEDRTANTISSLGESIIHNIHQPKELESLYRSRKEAFTQSFDEVYPTISHEPLAQAWQERLHFKQEGSNWFSRSELIFLLIAAVVTALLAKIPQFTSIKDEFFYPRNLGLLGFGGILTYFNWKQASSTKQRLVTLLALVLPAIYMNALPYKNTDTILLACIHLPMVLWAVLGWNFSGGSWKNKAARAEFLQYNGDLIVICALLGISGMLFSGITVALFGLLGLKIENFYFENIGVLGASGIPILGTILVRNNASLVNRISPLIARIFTPLVFIALLTFLVALFINTSKIYQDRNFLLNFNVLLIAVMAIILFSASEASKSNASQSVIYMLFGLSVLTVILNSIALSAIIFRISEFGFTPNRIAVIGGNLLIFSNLSLVCKNLFLTIKGKKDLPAVVDGIAAFLPVYGAWAAFIVLIFPLLWGFK